MKLYTKAGWLDVPHVNEICDRNNISFIIIIGKRQVGKTYNVLKYMLDENKCFMLLRGMRSELEMLKQNANSPFEKIKGYEERVKFKSTSEYTADIIRYDVDKETGEEKPTIIGMSAALGTIGRIRGFNGDRFSDVVYDEFIPESHLLKVRHAGDAFLNMYTTVSGNRELEDRAPLRVWLLANSNDLDNEILDALNITPIVEKMSLRGEEARMIPERGILILLPESKAVTEKRKKTALYRAIGGNSQFARMAYENSFAYNDYTDVSNKPLKEYKALVRLGSLVLHLHKNDKTLYFTNDYKTNVKYMYGDTEHGRMTFIHDFPEIKAAYMNGRIVFQSMAVKNKFLNFIDFR